MIHLKDIPVHKALALLLVLRALNQSTVDSGFTRENSPINKEKYSVSFQPLEDENDALTDINALIELFEFTESTKISKKLLTRTYAKTNGTFVMNDPLLSTAPFSL